MVHCALDIGVFYPGIAEVAGVYTYIYIYIIIVSIMWGIWTENDLVVDYDWLPHCCLGTVLDQMLIRGVNLAHGVMDARIYTRS